MHLFHRKENTHHDTAMMGHDNKGILRVTVEEAIFDRDTDKTGDVLDPYIVLRLGTFEKRTTALREAGKMPVWNQTIDIPYAGEDRLTILAMDEDIGGADDKVGECVIDVRDLLRASTDYAGWFEIKKRHILHKARTGRVRLGLHFLAGGVGMMAPTALAGSTVGLAPSMGAAPLMGGVVPVANVAPVQGLPVESTLPPTIISGTTLTSNVMPVSHMGTGMLSATSGLAATPGSHGILRVAVEEAIFDRDTDKTGDVLDPYIVLRLGTHERRTTALREAGKMPVWNQTLELPYNNERELTILAMDEDVGERDDKVGRCDIDLHDLMRAGAMYSGWFELKKRHIIHKAHTGRLRLSINVMPVGGFAHQGAGMGLGMEKGLMDQSKIGSSAFGMPASNTMATGNLLDANRRLP